MPLPFLPHSLTLFKMFKGRIARDKVGPNTSHTASRVEGTASLVLDSIAHVCDATHRLSCVVRSGEIYYGPISM
jgi:hypothetical protein